MAFETRIIYTGMPGVRLEGNEQGGMTLFIEGTSGDGRVFTFNNDGGVFKLTLLGNLPDNLACGALDAGRRIVPVLG